MVLIGGGALVMVAGGAVAGAWTVVGGRMADARAATWAGVGCTASSCGDELREANSNISRAQTLAAVGWVTLAVGGVATAAGLYWYISSPRSDSRSTRSSLRVSLAGTGIDVMGTC